eukprot:gene5469-9287_t
MSEEVTKKLPARSTRGKRLTELISDEIEVDNKFYSEVFEDEENEEEKADFKITEEEEDLVDSDFDLEEDLSIITPQVDTVETSTTRKNVYKDPLKKKTLKKTPVRRTPSSTKKKEKTSDDITPRKSNRANTVKASEELQFKLSVQEPTVRRKKRKLVHVPMTQEELMKESKKTAQINTKSLENLIQIEEEKKKVVKSNKTVIEGPMIRFLSKNGKQTIIFANNENIPSCINVKEDEDNLKSRGLCVVSGMEAKYVDPLTGVSYATVDAFKKIRESFEQFKTAFGDHATDPNFNDKMFLK